MLLRKIKTRGFLGHYGATGGSNGVPDFVELDFTDTDLSLVHGENGAGKSTVWDALLFCFFKEHRGGSLNFARLIHDRSDCAEVSVEFEIDNQLWEIYGEITKNKRGKANVVRYVRSLSDNNATKAESDEAVEQWVKENLRMSAQTFTSAVLLRQGEADKFLRTKPKQRKEILLELLQLDFYRKLGDEATKRKNEHKKASDKVDAELTQIVFDSPDEQAIENQQKHIESIEFQIENLNEQQKRKTVELSDAQQAEKFSNEIAKIEELQQADKQLFERATEIRSKFNRLCELETSLMRLEKLWETKGELNRETESLQKVSAEIAGLEADLRNFSEKLSAANLDTETAQKEANEAEKAFQSTNAKLDELSEQLRQIEEIEKLETAISEKQKELAPYQNILADRRLITSNFQRFQQLSDILQSLRNLQQCETNLQIAENQLGELENDSRQKEESVQLLEEDLESLRSKVEARESEQLNLQTQLNDCRSDLKLFQEKLARRDSVTGEIECPTCGTILDEQQAERLNSEITEVGNKISALEVNEINLSDAIEQNKTAFEVVKSEKKAHEDRIQEIANQITAVRVNVEHANRRVENCRNLFTEAAHKVGNLKVENLPELENEFVALEKASKANEELDQALQIEGRVNAVIQNLLEQTGNYPIFSSDKREEIKRDAMSLRENLQNCETRKHEAADNLTRLSQKLNDFQTQTIACETTLKNKIEVFGDLQTRTQTLQQKAESVEKDLSSVNDEIKIACDDYSHFELLQTEKNNIQKFVIDNEKLSEAEDRQKDLKGQLTTWRKQLNEIPVESRRDVKTVEDELEEINYKLSAENENLKFAENDLCEMRNRQAAVAIKQSEFMEAAKTTRLWSKLADAFGKKGLEGRIVQSAQESVKQNANTVLESLSSGTFQIELEESANGEELQILVRDLSTQNTTDKARAFEFFSGGESLLIAISLAIGIGQSISGSTVANTLIIDEGFGALDNKRREFLVDELRRLSSDILQNGRVIVVSHQDDVKEKFNNRYLLTKNTDGLINIEMYGRV